MLVIEELDNFLEEHIRALGIACDGKNLVPNIGELTPSKVEEIKAGRPEGSDGDDDG